MGLPSADSAEIEEAKILGYLLSSTHDDGQSKAAFFGKHGFSPAQWQLLASALRRHAKTGSLVATKTTAYGPRYVVDGELVAPDGTRLNVRSVWFINERTGRLRFATAHPLKRKR